MLQESNIDALLSNKKLFLNSNQSLGHFLAISENWAIDHKSFLSISTAWLQEVTLMFYQGPVNFLLAVSKCLCIPMYKLHTQHQQNFFIYFESLTKNLCKNN